MNAEGDTDRSSNSEPKILGNLTDIIEWPLVPPRDTVIRGFYDLERLRMMNSRRIQIIFRVGKSIGEVDTHQH
ncbi:hypothetical protein AYI69_g8644 [Smittium culicis]|uniref:Uncharacterized protein n=1 Tax=Smittium culicis TaxID=133412 RepID=A0A1R1XI97_9FUNG|nr:hypothetical protein AYI69_g8644 [Smittium culicis]